jgi:hypothetical protein
MWDNILPLGALYLFGLFFGNAAGSYFDWDFRYIMMDERKSSTERFVAFLKASVLVPLLGILVMVAVYFIILAPLAGIFNW